MKLKHDPIIADTSKPFLNCKLEREKYATVLTQIVSNYADGFVLAINNEWGAGKTTFVKMWQQQLKNQQFETLYFNAWENDYENEPLVALLAELKHLKIKDGAALKKIIKTGAALTKSIFPVLIQALAEKYIDTKILKEAIGEISKDASEVFLKEVEGYATRKEDMNSFKKQLEEFVKKQTPNKPLIFIIDELDRCRPDYAVQVLESVKHFFSVEGIVFVLSIDKEQLQHAIRGFYGNSNIDAENYLRRFIDIEYQIPAPNIKQHVSYLFQYFNLGEFFFLPERTKYYELRDDEIRFKQFACALIPKLKISLRNQEKSFALTRLILTQFDHNQYVLPDILFFLIALKLFKYTLYHKIVNKELTIQHFVNETEGYFLELDYGIYNVEYIYTSLIIMYKTHLDDNRTRIQNEKKLMDSIGNSEFKLTFETKLDNNKIVAAIKDRENSRNGVSLSYLFEKVSLTSDFVKVI